MLVLDLALMLVLALLLNLLIDYWTVGSIECLLVCLFGGSTAISAACSTARSIARSMTNITSFGSRLNMSNHLICLLFEQDIYKLVQNICILPMTIEATPFLLDSIHCQRTVRAFRTFWNILHFAEARNTQWEIHSSKCTFPIFPIWSSTLWPTIRLI